MPPRSNWTGRTVVYRYGCPARADLNDVAMEQLRLAHDLRNALVEIELRYADAVAAAWAEHPAVAEAQARVEEVTTELDAWLEQVAKEKQRERTRTVSAGLQASVKRARTAKREAKLLHKEAKQRAYETLAPRFHELNQAKRDQQKATYADFVQMRGLTWSTYNDVVAQHERAGNAIKAARQAGKPAQRRFKRWDGTGSLAVQLQREAKDGPRTPEVLAAGEGKWRHQVQLPWIPPEQWEAMTPSERRKAQRVEMSIRVASGPGRAPIWQDVPVALHRPIPADADITDVRLSRRRIASKTRLSLEVTVRLPDVPSRIGPGTAGVDVGWRSMPDGSIRVGVWRFRSVDADRPRVPAHLLDTIQIDSTGGELVIPADRLDQWHRVDKLRSTRDQSLDLLRKDLVEALTNTEGLPEYLGRLIKPDEEGATLTAADVSKWRSPARFAALAIKLREVPSIEPAPGLSTGDLVAAPAQLAERMEAWRKQDKHLWDYEGNLSHQLTDWRKDAYRVAAALITSQISTLVVEKPFVAAVQRKPATENEDTQQAEKARWQARIAAAASFVQALTQAAQARGVEVVVADSTGTSRVHYGCGTEFDPDALKRAINVECPRCGAVIDQDDNAALHLLDEASVAPKLRSLAAG